MASAAPSTIVVGVGYVGRRLLAALPRDDAVGLSRSGGGRTARIRALDLDEPDAGPVDFAGRPSLVYTVPPARDDDGDRRLRTFLRLLTFRPGRFVYLSTTGVYGDCNGAIVDETAAPAPGSARAARRVAAERLLADFCDDAAVDLVVLRVPGIYGPGRLGVDRIRKAQPVLDEADANPGNRIHVDDLVACCVAALADAVPAGTYNVGDGDERSSTWFAAEIARQLGLEPPPEVSRARAEREFSPRRLSFLRESRRLDLTKMREILKVRPGYADAADGIAASIAAQRN